MVSWVIAKRTKLRRSYLKAPKRHPNPVPYRVEIQNGQKVLVDASFRAATQRARGIDRTSGSDLLSKAFFPGKEQHYELYTSDFWQGVDQYQYVLNYKTAKFERRMYFSGSKYFFVEFDLKAGTHKTSIIYTHRHQAQRAADRDKIVWKDYETSIPEHPSPNPA